jgi:Uma2 family endonuclease
MATKPALRHWAYGEYARLPDDGNRYEVIAGELFVTPSPRTLHQEVVGEFYTLLKAFVRTHGLGKVLVSPIDVIFGTGDYLVPDVVFVRRERQEIVTRRGVEGTPDLVIEVLSDSTVFRDRGIKRERYAHFGVAQYWIVDPHTQVVQVYRLLEDASRPSMMTSEILEWQPDPDGPTLTIDLVAFFRDLD